jgi:hypothetical protein
MEVLRRESLVMPAKAGDAPRWRLHPLCRRYCPHIDERDETDQIKVTLCSGAC